MKTIFRFSIASLLIVSMIILTKIKASESRTFVQPNFSLEFQFIEANSDTLLVRELLDKANQLPPSEAIQLLDSAESLAAKQSWVTGLDLVYKAKASKYYDNKEYSKSREYMIRQLNLPNYRREVRSEISLLKNVAHCFTKQSRADSALVYLEAAIRAADLMQLHDPLLGRVYIEHGACLDRLGDFKEAKSSYREALSQFKIHSDTQNIIRSYNKLGINERKLGNYKEAVGYITKAEKLADKIGDIESQVKMKFSLANIYGSMGNVERSLHFYDLAEKASRNSTDSLFRAKIFTNSASMLARSGKIDSALVYFYQAEKIALAEDDKGLLTIIYQQSATCYFLSGNLSEAEKYYLKSRSLAQAAGNKGDLMRINNNLGQLLAAQGNFDKGRVYLNEALTYAKKLNNKMAIQSCYNGLSDLEYESGNFKEAIDNMRLMHLYKDSVINEKNNKALEKLRVEFETEKKQKEVEMLKKNAQIKDLDLKRKVAENEMIKLENIEKEKNLVMLESEARLLQLENEAKEQEAVRKSLEMENLNQSLALLEVEQVLKDEQILIQSVKMRNQLLGFIGFFIFIGSLLWFIWYRKKSKLSLEMAMIENKLLRSQMKPHFVFNALNSVNNYITSNKNESASKYLVKFSNIIRSFLHNSIDDYVLLGEEVRNLTDYIEIEQENYNNSFRYQFDIDDKIELDNTKIPALILQPFIENAIIHGLSNLESREGKLEIIIKHRDNLLSCIIRDNGLGRNTSTANEKVKKRSVGLSLTERRLRLMQPNSSVDFLQYKDLQKGFQVEIKIPFATEY